MTKKDLAQAIQSQTSINFNLAMDCVRIVCEAMANGLAKGDNVYLRGFGTFRIETRKAKPARLIKAGKPIILPEHKVIKFKPCEKLKHAVK